MVKREFANQDDTVSQTMYELLDTVNRSQSRFHPPWRVLYRAQIPCLGVPNHGNSSPGG